MEDQTTNNPENIDPFSDKKVLYKQWSKFGFLSVDYWANDRLDRVVVEIGSVNDGKLQTAVKCYVNAWEFMAYLRAEVSGRVMATYPDYAKGDGSDRVYNGISWFGGGPAKDKPFPVESRVLSINIWKDREGKPDMNGRDFKAGSYEGKTDAGGAIKPVFSNRIAVNNIKVTPAQLATIYERLNARVLAEEVAKVMAK